MTLRLRPHHLLCALGYRGLGYSDAFTANMTRLVTDGLHAAGGAEVEIELVAAADDICAPCPKRRGAGCTTGDKIAGLDARHGAALGVAPGDRLSWGAARARIRDAVQPGDLARLCAGCRWLDLGICEAALQELHDTAMDDARD